MHVPVPGGAAVCGGGQGGAAGAAGGREGGAVGHGAAAAEGRAT